MGIFKGRLVSVGPEATPVSKIGITSEEGEGQIVNTSDVILTDDEVKSITEARSKSLEDSNKALRTKATEKTKADSLAKDKDEKAKNLAHKKEMLNPNTTSTHVSPALVKPLFSPSVKQEPVKTEPAKPFPWKK